ncbi:DUF6334 family protein [uncultured Sphingomonas sp.]|uniref:DUF6334 family protein n=1 Tax=uncultured Sphingomonas sp. TaxID=158754 RepID=UPI0025F6F35C|nr:DUF6334 family protein [uncultured Sphingomonas sp.]
MADRTMLNFDYDEAHGQVTTAVLGRRDGAAGWHRVAVVIKDRALMLRVDPDTDEIAVGLAAALSMNSGWLAVAELSDFVGSELGWCWVGRNYWGYLDMFTLSFSGLEPQLCFTGDAATISIRRILPVS